MFGKKATGEKGDENNTDPAVQAMLETLQGLTKAVSDMPKQVAQAVSTQIAAVIPQNQDGEGGDPEPDPQPAPQDLETLSRAEFMDLIVNRVQGVIEKSIKPVEEQVQEARMNVTKTRLERDVEAAAAKHPDFWEWQEEIATLLKANPALTVEQAYVVVRGENPDKAKEVDERIQEMERKKQEEENAAKKEQEEEGKVINFGGLLPTSTPAQRGGSDEKPEFEDTRKAAEAAFAEIFPKDYAQRLEG